MEGILMRDLGFSALMLIGLCLAAPASGQSDLSCPWSAPAEFLTDRASPPDSAILQLGNGVVKVCYSRPSARGRVIFGELVPYDRVWRTGANEPTMLFLTTATEVAGVRLDPGRYLLLTSPRRDEWSVVINSAEGTTPEELLNNAVERGIGAVPSDETEDFIETFTIRGTGDGPEGALTLEWERTRVEIPLRAIASP